MKQESNKGNVHVKTASADNGLKLPAWLRNDVTLNLSLKEGMVRAIIALVSPIIIGLAYKYIIIMITPVIAYLYLTAMTRYCIIKYLWRRYVSHHALVKRAAYGMDINYPEESLPLGVAY